MRRSPAQHRVRPHQDRRGAAATEMAIIASLLCFLIGGTVDWCSTFFVRHHMIQATREAARVHALSGTTAEMAEARAKNYLTFYYPTQVAEGKFTVSASTEEPTGSVVWVEVSIAYSDADLLGGWALPKGEIMSTRLYMRGE